MDHKKLVSAVAETVVQSMGSPNTVKQITKQDEENGWTKFIIALADCYNCKVCKQKIINKTKAPKHKNKTK